MKNAQQAGMLCNEPLFRAFLKSRPEVRIVAGSPLRPWVFLRTKEDAADAIRYLLDIQSRRQLNDAPYDAQWREMVADYELWKADV